MLCQFSDEDVVLDGGPPQGPSSVLGAVNEAVHAAAPTR